MPGYLAVLNILRREGLRARKVDREIRWGKRKEEKGDGMLRRERERGGEREQREENKPWRD